MGLSRFDPDGFITISPRRADWGPGIWKIIRGWLDPVVAAKIQFANNRKELEEVISPDRILKEMDGDEDWQYKYVEPVPGENDRMKDTATRDRMLAAREEIVRQYEEATLRWVKHAGSENGANAKAERNSIAARLREDYWILDPYIRARSLYDRTGVIKPMGKIDFYPEAANAAPVNGTTVTAVTAETSADDVD